MNSQRKFFLSWKFQEHQIIYLLNLITKYTIKMTSSMLKISSESISEIIKTPEKEEVS